MKFSKKELEMILELIGKQLQAYSSFKPLLEYRETIESSDEDENMKRIDNAIKKLRKEHERLERDHIRLQTKVLDAIEEIEMQQIARDAGITFPEE